MGGDADRSDEPSAVGGSTETSSTPARRRTVPTAISLVVLAVLVGGAFGIVNAIRSAVTPASELIPKDAIAYLWVDLEPAEGQAQEMRGFFRRFPMMRREGEAGDVIDELLDDAFSDNGLSFHEHIEPWLQQDVALFVAPPSDDDVFDLGVVAGTSDPGAAMAVVRESMRERGADTRDATYEDVEYVVDEESDAAAGVVGEHLVYGTQGAVRGAILADARNSSLSSEDRFLTATEPLEEDHVALAYYDPLRLADALPPAMVTPQLLQGPFGLASQGPIAAAAYVTGGKAVVDLTMELPDDERLARPMRRLATREDLIDDVPDFAWAAFGYPEFGETLQLMVDAIAESAAPGLGRAAIMQEFRRQTGLDLQRDLLSWMGDIRFYASGTSEEDEKFVLVIESKDDEKARRAIGRIGGLLKLQGEDIFFPRGERWSGFYFTPPSGRQDSILVVQDPRLRNQVLIAQGSWWDTYIPIAALPKFNTARDSLGQGFVPFGYVDGDKLLDYLSNTYVLPFGENEIKDNLGPLDFVVAGSRIDGGRILQRIVVSLDEE